MNNPILENYYVADERMRRYAKHQAIVGDRVSYYTGGLRGTVTAVDGRNVHVKWDNGAPDLGPYPLGQPTSSVRLV